MGIRFASRRMAISGLIAGALMATASLAFLGSDFAPIAGACVPVAVAVGLLLAGRVPRSVEWRQFVLPALVFGVLVALGGVLLFTLVAETSALLPGSAVARPETPLGNLIFLVIVVASLTPFVAIGTVVVGLVWAVALGVADAHIRRS